MPELETVTEYSVAFTREDEEYSVLVPDVDRAQELADAYYYDRENSNIRVMTREVTEWVEA